MVDELRASRARIAEATHEGRVSIERDLHDGAQPLLSALVIKLGIARDLATDPELRALLDEAGDDTAAAAEELRRLARGIYPPVLRERGVAERAAGVRADGAGERAGRRGGRRAPTRRRRPCTSRRWRRSRTRSSTAAPACRWTLTLERSNGRLAFAVTDDGRGFDGAVAATASA